MEKKKLRSGYTTGTCAAIAAKAAAKMIFEQKDITRETVITPKKIKIETKIQNIKRQKETVSCAVQKDAGDDPDVTNGILVYAEVTLQQNGEIIIDGGVGVGRVTKKGLWQEIGEPAINRVPRQMIREAVQEVLDQYGYLGGAKVIISIPEGVEIAKKTFNERLGIVGGLSILGTSGIVEPMSEQALIDTIHVEMNVAAENNHGIMLVTPGNYGAEFVRENLQLSLENAVKCSNYLGEMMDYAKEIRVQKILLTGHVGKLIKLAGNIMNTHSHMADCRMEILGVHAAMAGADTVTVKEIMECISTDEAIGKMKEQGCFLPAMDTIMEKIRYYTNLRSEEKYEIEVIMFSNEWGILGQTQGAGHLVEEIRNMQSKK